MADGEKSWEIVLTVNVDVNWKLPPTGEGEVKERESFEVWARRYLFTVFFSDLQKMVNEVARAAGEYPSAL